LCKTIIFWFYLFAGAAGGSDAAFAAPKQAIRGGGKGVFRPPDRRTIDLRHRTRDRSRCRFSRRSALRRARGLKRKIDQEQDLTWMRRTPRDGFDGIKAHSQRTLFLKIFVLRLA